MDEYIANGACLAWLLDPSNNRATIYRPGQPPERIDNPDIISGDPILPGFKFDYFSTQLNIQLIPNRSVQVPK